MRRSISILALALAACSTYPGEQLGAGSAAAAETQASEPLPDATVRTLAGHWRVAGIDGQPFNESYGLALVADENQIWWKPRCARIVRNYRIEGTRIAITEVPPPAADAGPTIICTVGPPPRLKDVVRALDSATHSRRTAANGIELSGGGHSVTLFSQ